MSVLPRLRLLLAGAIVLLGSGCATSGGMRAVTSLDRHQACDTQYVVEGAPLLRLDAEQPLRRELGAGSARCTVSVAATPALYVAFRLPAFDRPYRVTVESRITGGALFAPELRMLDGDGRVVRTFGYDRFSPRGDVLQATVFMNPEDARERYLVVGSATGAVGQTSLHHVSGTVIIPMLAGPIPMLGVHGTESTETTTLSYNGELSLHADSASESARWAARRKAGTSQRQTDAGFCCRM